MFKTLLKIVFTLVGVVLVLVAGLALTFYLSLQAKPPSSYFELQGTPPAAGAPPVLIFGATRGTGLEVAKLLSERGEDFVAFVRPTSDRTELEKLNAAFVVGDATNMDEVQTAVSSQPFRAIVSTIGCLSCDPPPDFIGNRNITDAAVAAGVPRMILITSLGAGDSKDAAPFASRLFLREILPLKEQAEEHLKASGLAYTIIRPGGLLQPDAPVTGQGYLSEDRMAFGFMTRPDLAEQIVGALDDERTIGKTFAAADKTVKSPF
jgi:nucleoside-diphosphate-sugar epimerase